MSTAAHVGMVLGNTYRLERLLGEGGMGSVYEATHLRVPRRFAVKLLNPDVVGNKQIFERFQREAEIASSLGSEHITQVFDFNHADDGTPYMVLELLEGEDLSQRLRRGRMSMAETLEVVEQVTKALEAAHLKGIVHRDLKPSNLFLCRRNEKPLVKVMDFGISKVLHGGSESTRTGMVLGTPNYMAPEQAEGRQSEIDPRSDLFAMGAIIYECLTGRVAFQGPTPIGTLYQVCNGVPDPMRAFAPEIPDSVEQVVWRALAKRRDDRYQRAGDLRNAFAAACRGISLELAPAALAVEPPATQVLGTPIPMMMMRGTPAPMTAGQPVPTTLGGAASEMRPETIQPKGRSRWPIIVGAVCVVGIGAAVALGVGGGDKKPVAAAADPSPPIAAPAAVPTTPAPAPAEPVAVAPAPAPEPAAAPIPPPELVTLALHVTPRSARIELDGQAIEQGTLSLPRSDTPRRLVVSASGYQSVTRELRAIADGEIKIYLTRSGHAKPKPGPETPRSKGPVEDTW